MIISLYTKEQEAVHLLWRRNTMLCQQQGSFDILSSVIQSADNTILYRFGDAFCPHSDRRMCGLTVVADISIRLKFEIWSSRDCREDLKLAIWNTLWCESTKHKQAFVLRLIIAQDERSGFRKDFGLSHFCDEESKAADGVDETKNKVGVVPQMRVTYDLDWIVTLQGCHRTRNVIENCNCKRGPRRYASIGSVAWSDS